MSDGEVHVRRAALDKRAYRFRSLPNGLQVLLVHDATADKAAAALDVAVGFSADPETLPGLAHFTEHMLFLGTQKYPEEDSYTTFLSAHGGHSNAHTAYENTQYYFDVQHPFLAEALDRFAQFFLGPLFTPSATARELNAIESEHAKNLQSDAWRLQEIGRWLARRDHPYHKFGTGSLATLRDVPERLVRLELRPAAADGGVAVATSLTVSHRPGLAIRDALARFHTEHYSSSRMRLVVLGRETLDELEALVAPPFGGVPRRSDPPPADHGHPYGAAQLCRRVQLAPVRNLRTLSLQWPVPPLRPLWSNKPQRFLGHLIGHESKGSFFSLLRACGWVESLSAGEGHGARSYSTFEVKMVLTKAGDEHVDEIARLVFEYIALLRSAPPERWVWDECRELGELGFRFAEPMEPCDAVGHLASALDFFPPEHVMSASFIFGDFEPTEIVAILSELTPRRVILTHQSPAFEGRLKLVEPRYGALYSAEPLAEELVQSWERATPRDALHLPLPNSFIPTDFSLVCDDAAAGERAEAAVEPTATARCPAGHALCLERVKPDDYREFDGDSANCDVCDASYDYADGGYHCSACGDWDCCVTCGAAGGATAEASHQPSLTNAAATAAATAAVDAVASASTDAFSDAIDAPALISPSALAALPSPPTCLRNDRSAELWHKLDRTFRRPRVNVLINVLAPCAYESPAGAVMARLFTRLLGDELNEYSYDAEVAGLHYKLQNSVTGLQLMVAGYSHKLPVLVGKVLERVRDPELDPQRFAVMREQAARDYQNVFKDSPYTLAVYGVSMLLEEKKWHLSDYLEFVTSDACTVEATRAFAMRSLLGRLRPQVFCHGNMSASEATAMVEDVCRVLGGSPLSTSELPQLRVLEIPAGRPVTIRYHPNRLKAPLAGLPSADETNSAVEVYLQAGRDTRPRAEMLDILVQVLHTRAEQQLRTVEQLGYLVWCTTRFDRGVAGLRFIVQSSTHDAATLDARIEAFLETVPSILAQLSQEDFASYRKALIDQTLETDKRLRDETTRHWNEVVPYGEYDFDRAAKDACSFAKLTRRDLCAFWDECLSHKSAQRRRLSSQVFAPRHALPPKPPNALYLDSIDELIAFKYALNAYPAPGAKGRLSGAWGRCPGLS